VVREKGIYFREKFQWVWMLIRVWLGSRDVWEKQREHSREMAEQIQAALDYEPAPYPGWIDLVRAERPPRSAPIDPEAGWTGIPKRGIRVHIIPGNHFDMFNPPNDRVFISTLEGCIEAAEKELLSESNRESVS